MHADLGRRRTLALGLSLGLGVCAAVPRTARAQAYPSRPVKLIVGAPPGGPADFMARLSGDALAAALGQSFIVDNRAGASGTVAAEAAARAPADGYTLLIGAPGAIVVAPHLFPKLGYDAARELIPVSALGAGAFVLAVHPSLPARTLAEFVALAKSRPQALSYGSGGNGSSGQLCTESFALGVGAQMLHVPYKGDGQAMNDLLGGQIQFMFTAPNVAIPHAKAGRLRILAVTSRERLAGLPEVPSVHEAALKDFEYLGWIISFAPAGTPRPVIEALQSAWAAAREQPAIRGKLEELGMRAPAHLNDPKALEPFLAAERARVARVVREAGIKAD